MSKTILKYSLLSLLFVGLAMSVWIIIQSVQQPDLPQASMEQKPKTMRADGKKIFVVIPPPKQSSVVFIDDQGNKKHLADFKGKVVLLNIWATWCSPCVEEMPALDQLQAHFDRKDFEIVAVAFDKTIEEVRAFYTETKLTNLPPYLDQKFAFREALARENQPDGIPISVLYDANGTEQMRVIGGYDWASPAAIAQIEQMIADMDRTKQAQ